MVVFESNNTYNRNSDDSDNSSGECGITIIPRRPMAGIKATVSSMTVGLDSWGIDEVSTGNTLYSDSGGTPGSGETVTMDYTLDVGTEYIIWGNSTTIGYVSNKETSKTQDFDVTGGSNQGNTGDYKRTFKSLTAIIEGNGNASQTFTTQASTSTWTPETDHEATIEVFGARGYDVALGGAVKADTSVTSGETYTIYVGETATDEIGGTGWYDGGDGETSDFGLGGGGGGTAAVVDSSGTGIVVADAGGGDASSSDNAGGGARGGASGGGNATSGGGSGYGGDGGSTDSISGGVGGYETNGANTIRYSKNGGGRPEPFVAITYEKVPSAPTNLSSSATSDYISLSWTDNSNDEDGFYVYRSQSSGTSTTDYTQIVDLSSNTTSYDDTGLLDGERYYYRVTAYRGNTESDVSNETNSVTALPAPSNLSLNT